MHIGRQGTGAAAVAERGTYHHGNLRVALVEAGLELARTGGAAAVGLREVTRRVGVSPTAAYRHFADRDGLLTAVATEIKRRMAVEMGSADRRPVRRPRDPAQAGVAALRAVGLGYIDFACAEPGWFEVAFTDFGDGPDDPSAVSPPYAALVGALDGLVEAGVLSRARRHGAEWPCWSAVHGFALLVLHGPLRHVAPAERRRSAVRTVDAIIAGVIGETRPQTR